jgi:hypothetical protein
MEGWRQWRLGGRKTLSNKKTHRTLLTPTSLLMEGHYAQTARCVRQRTFQIYVVVFPLETTVVFEVVTTFSSFRFPELSQPI